MKATVRQAAEKVMALLVAEKVVALLEESKMRGAHGHHIPAFAEVMAKRVVVRACTTCPWPGP